MINIWRTVYCFSFRALLFNRWYGISWWPVPPWLRGGICWECKTFVLSLLSFMELWVQQHLKVCTCGPNKSILCFLQWPFIIIHVFDFCQDGIFTRQGGHHMCPEIQEYCRVFCFSKTQLLLLFTVLLLQAHKVFPELKYYERT